MIVVDNMMLIVLIFILQVCIFVAPESASSGVVNIRPLACNSVSLVPEGKTTEYIFITNRKNDCNFIFEGPARTQLELSIKRSPVLLSSGIQDSIFDKCYRNILRIYDYVNQDLSLNKMICGGNETTVVRTRSNLGIITTALNEGMVIVRVRPQSPLRLFRELIDGMNPPQNSASNFFYIDPQSNLISDAAGDEGFEPLLPTNFDERQQNVFRPSPPFPSQAIPQHLNVYYGAPAQQINNVKRPYLGKPTAFVDITYNSTGLNLTQVTFPETNKTHVSIVTIPEIEGTTKNPVTVTTTHVPSGPTETQDDFE